MNCFEWRNRTSEYLDGSLMGPAKREADEHLESCEACHTRHEHFREILGSIASQPRTTLPVAIRKAPLSTTPVSLKGGSKNRGIPLRERVRKWQDLPWYIRVPTEGAGMVIMIILAISAGPRMRMIYESKVEKSLTEFTEGFDSDSDTTSEHLAHGTLTSAIQATEGGAAEATDSGSQVTNDDFSSGEEGDSAGDNEDDAPVKAGNSETWRFNLKTDSPHDVRGKIVEILTSLKIPPNTPGINGIEAPGGIQFDLIVPQSVIPDLKQALEKIAPAPPKDLEDSPFGETFTWYKKKSRNPLPKGQTHVVIWLAQV